MPLSVTAYDLAHGAARCALRRVPFLPASIYAYMCPLVSPRVVNQQLYAPDVPVENTALADYMDFWQMCNCSGLLGWLRICHTLRTEKHYAIEQLVFPTDWTLFYKMVSTYRPELNIQTLLIPHVRLHPGAGDSIAECTTLSVAELLTEYPSYSPADVLSHIMQIILFGFAIEKDIVTALRIPPKVLLTYVTNRLRQGLYDYLLRDGRLATSCFDAPLSRSEYQHMNHHLAKSTNRYLSTLDQPISFNQQQAYRKAAAHSIRNAYTLGSNRKTVQQMMNNDLYTPDDGFYRHYLQTTLLPNTLAYGPNALQDLTTHVHLSRNRRGLGHQYPASLPPARQPHQTDEHYDSD